MKVQFLNKKNLLSILIIIFGVILFLYPWISNYLYERSVSSDINAYKKNMDQLPKKTYEKMLEAAREYNKELLASQIRLTDPFQENSSSSLNYRKILNLNQKGMMGYLKIPVIDLCLPIYHGTSEESLENGIGHLENSSFPIGGLGVHSILTGHTGLNRAKMFTDLTEMKVKDKFFLHIGNKNLAYKVERIFVIKPEDTRELRIQREKDYVTLITCTPYGINNRRLCVRGSRIPYERKDEKTCLKRKGEDKWMHNYKQALRLGLGIFGIYCALEILRTQIKRRKGKIR